MSTKHTQKIEWLCNDCLRVITTTRGNWLCKTPYCICGSQETCECGACKNAIAALRDGERDHRVLNLQHPIAGWTEKGGVS